MASGGRPVDRVRRGPAAPQGEAGLAGHHQQVVAPRHQQAVRDQLLRRRPRVLGPHRAAGGARGRGTALVEDVPEEGARRVRQAVDPGLHLGRPRAVGRARTQPADPGRRTAGQAVADARQRAEALGGVPGERQRAQPGEGGDGVLLLGVDQADQLLVAGLAGDVQGIQHRELAPGERVEGTGDRAADGGAGGQL
ncbi:hypothetical protein [Nocardioides sp. TF02-7]|uniref:hypothetical protein n=1 Tax=Nocardioides sp. TF02-7 TaxID=2917724 RepID=UPI001F067124|nr:hypothetical protein [Nocardioides sp. TF02-7]UMG91365.1 hypothetical protein MF408_14515 [Nocardioides sp. TF02-7]